MVWITMFAHTWNAYIIRAVANQYKIFFLKFLKRVCINAIQLNIFLILTGQLIEQ